MMQQHKLENEKEMEMTMIPYQRNQKKKGISDPELWMNLHHHIDEDEDSEENAEEAEWMLRNFEFFKLWIQMMIVLTTQLLQCGFLHDLIEELPEQMQQQEQLILH